MKFCKYTCAIHLHLCAQNDPGMDVLGLQGMIDSLPQTVDTTFSSNL